MLLSLARPLTQLKIPAISVIVLYVYVLVISKVKSLEETNMADELAESNIKFALDLFKAIVQGRIGENIFLSPFSIQTAFAMLHLGARNNSKSELERLLHLTSDVTHEESGKYLKLLNRQTTSYSLSSANRVFMNNKFTFLEEFLHKLQTFYSAEAEKCDFGGNPKGEAEKINKWVEGQTNSKIKDLVSSDLLGGLTAMVLVNAIYFKGNWMNKFDPETTEMKKFHVDKATVVKVPMMRMSKEKFNFNFHDELDCSVVELPFQNKELSMFFVLPRQVDGLEKLEQNLSAEVIQKLTTGLHNVQVDLQIPKFKLEDTFDLKKVLKDIGVNDIFDGTKADLSGIDGTRNLFVSAALHKTFIEVNEEGAEAAAATAVTIMKRSLPIIEPFHADHPFLFMIRDNRSKIVLFLGRYVKPLDSSTLHEEL